MSSDITTIAHELQERPVVETVDEAQDYVKLYEEERDQLVEALEQHERLQDAEKTVVDQLVKARNRAREQRDELKEENERLRAALHDEWVHDRVWNGPKLECLGCGTVEDPDDFSHDQDCLLHGYDPEE